jgi:hypothetical protein
MHNELRSLGKRISYGKVEFEDLVSCRITKITACAGLLRTGQAARHKERNLLMRRRGVGRAA